MTHLVCWAVPVRGGYVLRADSSTAHAVAAGRARAAQQWGRQVSVLHGGGPAFSAELARRPASLAIEFAALNGAAIPAAGNHHDHERVWSAWLSLALGAALIAVSGGHWAPALAGTWLITGRRWLTALLGVGRSPQRPSPTSQPRLAVSALRHAGLAATAALVAATPDARVGSARAESHARALGLSDAACVYGSLARGATPPTLPRDVGIWVSQESLHDPDLIVPLPDEDPEAPDESADLTQADLSGTPGVLVR